MIRGRNTTAQARIFVSYGRGDDDPNYDDPNRSFMRRLYTDLVKAGYDVWWDRESLPSRALSFLHEIRDAVAASSRVILVVGEHALQSDYVTVEWQFALSQSIPVIPILRNGEYNSIPEALNHYNSPDFRKDAQYAQKLAELVRILAQPIAPLGDLIGVPPLPSAYIERETLLDVQALILADGEKPIVVTTKHQITIIYGVGGIGKSTLAAAIARSGEVRRAFPDGVFWIEMGKTPDPLARLSDIGAHFGDVKAEYHDILRAKQRLSGLLRDKQILIVVDDIWDYKHAEAFRLADTRCRIMVTTRLASIAAQLSVHGTPLGTLTNAEGVALFIERLGGGISEVSEECHEIIRMLSGHTLAVSIAAGRLSEEGVGYAPDLLRRLQEGKTFSTLKLHNDDKNLNLEKSLYLSYESLSPDMQRRFWLMGVFAADSTFDEYAVQTVWGDMDHDETHDTIKTLISAGMLERHDGQRRYNRHSLLCAYARALAPANELYDAQAIHFAFYESRHTQYGKDYLNHRAEIEADLENLREALMWGFEAETVRACNLLLVALDGYYYDYQPTAYRLLIKSALLFLTDEGSSFSEVQELNELSYFDDGDDPFDCKTETQTVSIIRQMDIRLSRANALKTLGDLSLREDDRNAGRDFYLSALPIYKLVNSRLGQANTLYALGKLHLKEDNLEDAYHAYIEALENYKYTNNLMGQINVYANLARLYRKTRQFEEAKTHYEYALTLADSSSAHQDSSRVQCWRKEHTAFIQSFT